MIIVCVYANLHWAIFSPYLRNMEKSERLSIVINGCIEIIGLHIPPTFQIRLKIAFNTLIFG